MGKVQESLRDEVQTNMLILKQQVYKLSMKEGTPFRDNLNLFGKIIAK